ncbi:MAG: hypothetical protein Q9208_002308 [Pyrenodesmia sp. 3 TL-2023]
MGNLLCAPVHREQFDGGDPVIKNMFQKLADEAEMNAKVRRQTYDRRKRREETGSRSNHRDGSRGEPIRGNGARDETYHTAPEGLAFDPQEAFLPGGPLPNPRFTAYPPVPPNRTGDYRPYPPAQPRDDMDDDVFEYGERGARSPPDQRHGGYFTQAGPRFTNGRPGRRGRQMPHRRKSPQGPDGPYMSGALPEEEEEEEGPPDDRGPLR